MGDMFWLLLGAIAGVLATLALLAIAGVFQRLRRPDVPREMPKAGKQRG
jgi:hypothetical protein